MAVRPSRVAWRLRRRGLWPCVGRQSFEVEDVVMMRSLVASVRCHVADPVYVLWVLVMVRRRGVVDVLD